MHFLNKLVLHHYYIKGVTYNFADPTQQANIIDYVLVEYSHDILDSIRKLQQLRVLEVIIKEQWEYLLHIQICHFFDFHCSQ